MSSIAAAAMPATPTATESTINIIRTTVGKSIKDAIMTRAHTAMTVIAPVITDNDILLLFSARHYK